MSQTKKPLTVTPIENERLTFDVQSGEETYRVDLEAMVCECEIIHSRKAGTICRHLRACEEFQKENAR